LLGNILLDELDKELERRGHKFCRYADDCNVYVQSKRAAERVMEGLVVLYAKVKLTVNPTKSAVAPAWQRSFLGYSFWVAPGKVVKRRVSPMALSKMKERVRELKAEERPGKADGESEVLAEIDWVMESAASHLGEERATRYLRKFYPWYLERLGGSKELRHALQTAPTLDAARDLLQRQEAPALAA